MATSPKPGLSQLLRSLFSLAVSLAVIGALLFVPAGTFDWPAGWLFALIFVVAILISLLYLWQVNPEIFVARTGIARGTRGWDLVLLPLVLLAFMAVLAVASLDSSRYHWSTVPDWLVWLGYLMFFWGFWINARAQAVNRHFEPGVRLQTDRAHAVVDTRPYAVVRHPGYIGGNLLALGMALALGSYWALLPAVLVIVLFAYRTLREDAMLQAELPGYAAYAARVRWRWVPNIW